MIATGCAFVVSNGVLAVAFISEIDILGIF
jgi:hypothetical protein